MQTRKESLPPDSLLAIVSLHSQAGVYTKHMQEGEMLPSPHKLLQCRKIMAQKITRLAQVCVLRIQMKVLEFIS